MGYTKHTWQLGEYISAELLNHIEEGIEQADAEAGNTATTAEVLEYLGITRNQSATGTGA